MDHACQAFVQLDIADLSDSARWLRGIATASQALATQENLGQAMRMALGCLGQAAQVEVVSVFQANGWGGPAQGMSARVGPNPESRLILSSRWSSEEGADEADEERLQGKPQGIWHPLPLRWQQEWLAGRVIYGPVENFPLEEQSFLVAQGVQSLVALPIQLLLPSGEASFWGVLGLEAQQPLNWSLTEISALWSLAASIGGAIARDAEQRRLQALNASLQAQVDALRLPAGSGTTVAESLATHWELPAALASQNLTEALADQRRQTKQNFLTRLHKSLSEPLHGVLGQAQRLNRTLKLGAEEEQGLAMIHQHGSQLLQQIHWMLDLDRLQSNALTLHPELVHLPSFLQGIVEVCRCDGEQVGRSLDYQPALNLPLGVSVDVTRLQQVLTALLKSARGEGEPRQITFSVRVLSQRITPRPQVHRLRFALTKAARDLGGAKQTSVEPGRVGEVEGDLAIALAQQLVRRMGGELLPEPWIATSNHWGFDLELPAQDDWHQQTLEEARVVGYEGPRRRILLVDDRWENRGVLTSLLGPLGFELCEAVEGQDGLKQLESFKPDLVITDLVMPVLDGFAMMAEIRAQAEWEELPILVSSASVELREQQRSLEQGGDDCLTKPIQLEELLGLLEKHLGLRWLYRDSCREMSLDSLSE